MNQSTSDDEIVVVGEKVLAALKGLNYRGVARHSASDVEQLKAVLEQLGIYPPDESLQDYASEQALPRSAPAQYDEEQAQQLLKEINRQLDDEGFGERLGCVYDSFAQNRRSPFNDMPRRGLPSFNLVVAPDFAPVAGLHGVFISDTEVMSIILPAEVQQARGDWEIVKRKSFKDAEQMMDIVTLITAGFDLS